MKPSAHTLDWLQNTFAGMDHVDRLRARRKEYRKWRKAVAKRKKIEAAHAMVDNWLNVLHQHEDPVGVWMRDNDNYHDYLG